jgi:hypothetical protein
MARRRYTAEEIITVLRQVEVALRRGLAAPQRDLGLTPFGYPIRSLVSAAFSVHFSLPSFSGRPS